MRLKQSYSPTTLVDCNKTTLTHNSWESSPEETWLLLQSLWICLSELPDSTGMRQLSAYCQGDVDSHRHMIRWSNWSRQRAGNIFRKFAITKSGRENLPLGEILVRKVTQWVSPTESSKSFAEVPWLVREVPTPSQYALWQFKSPHMREREKREEKRRGEERDIDIDR